MPAKKQRHPYALASAITTWLLANPGHHRPRDIAAGIGIPYGRTQSQATVDVGRECARMLKRGDLTETRGKYGREYAV